MLGKRFSFVVQKRLLLLDIFNLKWRNVTFFTKLSLRPQKRRDLLTKINKHYLFWLNFMAF